MHSSSILIADDDSQNLLALKEILESELWSILTAQDGHQALDMLINGCCGLAFLDFKMPGLNGLEVLHRLYGSGIQTPIIILTGYPHIDLAVQAMKMGARDFLTKPIGREKLIEKIQENLATEYPNSHILSKRMDHYLMKYSSDPSLGLAILCKHFGISQSYASKLFKEYTGSPFTKRLAFFRIQNAKKLLENTNLPVYMVAERCGIPNFRWFIEIFRRFENVTPKRYQQICRE